jgi:hypothetical protein
LFKCTVTFAEDKGITCLQKVWAAISKFITEAVKNKKVSVEFADACILLPTDYYTALKSPLEKTAYRFTTEPVSFETSEVTNLSISFSEDFLKNNSLTFSNGITKYSQHEKKLIYNKNKTVYLNTQSIARECGSNHQILD